MFSEQNLLFLSLAYSIIAILLQKESREVTGALFGYSSVACQTIFDVILYLLGSYCSCKSSHIIGSSGKNFVCPRIQNSQNREDERRNTNHQNILSFNLIYHYFVYSPIF